eukprot:3716146-Prymnesium_polylepis.1
MSPVGVLLGTPGRPDSGTTTVVGPSRPLLAPAESVELRSGRKAPARASGSISTSLSGPTLRGGNAANVAAASCCRNPSSDAVPKSDSARDMTSSTAVASESVYEAECRVLHWESLSSAVRSVVCKLPAAMKYSAADGSKRARTAQVTMMAAHAPIAAEPFAYLVSILRPTPRSLRRSLRITLQLASPYPRIRESSPLMSA